jgi:NADPH:quinone reductase-like Zn-dependent oxidoreductase
LKYYSLLFVFMKVSDIPTTMTSAYQVHLVDTSRDHNSTTALQNLVLRTDISKPIPGPGEALVRIRAAALNYRDLLVLVSWPLYIPTISGISPLADGAGTIVETGPGSIWEGSIGMNVLLCANQAWIDGSDAAQYIVERTLGAANVDGTLRQYAIVADHLLVKSPKNLNHEEAASMVAAGGAAIHALTSIDIREGTTVLTQGTGGVSCFAIQVS